VVLREGVAGGSLHLPNNPLPALGLSALNFVPLGLNVLALWASSISFNVTKYVCKLSKIHHITVMMQYDMHIFNMRSKTDRQIA